MTIVFPLRYKLVNYDSNIYSINLDIFSTKTKSFSKIKLYFNKFIIIITTDIKIVLRKLKYFFPSIEISLQSTSKLFTYIEIKNNEKKIFLNRTIYFLHIFNAKMSDVYNFLELNLFFFRVIEKVYLLKELNLYFYYFCKYNNIKNFYQYYKYIGKQLENKKCFEYFSEVLFVNNKVSVLNSFFPKIRIIIFDYLSISLNNKFLTNQSIVATIFISGVLNSQPLKKNNINIDYIILCLNKPYYLKNVTVLKNLILKLFKKIYKLNKNRIFIFFYKKDKHIFLKFEQILKESNTYYFITRNKKNIQKFLIRFMINRKIYFLYNCLNNMYLLDYKFLLKNLNLEKLKPQKLLNKKILQNIFKCSENQISSKLNDIIYLINYITSETIDLFNYTIYNKVIQKIFRISNFFNSSIDSFDNKNINFLYYNMFIYSAYNNKFIIKFDNKENVNKIKYNFLNGGISITKYGIFEKVAELDYKSFYPSIICGFNISFENISVIDITNMKQINSNIILIEEHNIYQLKKFFPNFEKVKFLKLEKCISIDFSNSKLLLPTVLKKFIRRRNNQYLSKINVELESFLKLQSNFIFGSFSKIIYCNKFNPITYLGRKIIIDSVKKVNCFKKSRAIGIETDSIFVSNISKNEIKNLIFWIQKDLTFKNINLENKNYYDYIIITKSSKYYFFKNNNKYKIKIKSKYKSLLSKLTNKYLKLSILKHLRSILKYINSNVY